MSPVEEAPPVEEKRSSSAIVDAPVPEVAAEPKRVTISEVQPAEEQKQPEP